MRYLLVLLFLLTLNTSSFAQKNFRFPAEDLKQLQAFEDTLTILSYAVVNDSLPEARFAATKKLIKSLVQSLKVENSFQYKFDRVKTMSVQYPRDSSFRIFTWQLFVQNGDYRYYGAIQMNNSELELFPLVDRSAEVNNPESDVLNNRSWYGNLVYKIHDFETPKGTSYVLFGFDRINFFNKVKIADILTFKDGQPSFGAPVFVNNKGNGTQEIKSRLILQYYAESTIKLNYEEVKEMIVYDHLIPFDGPHGFSFVPDGSYDGYKLENGFWILQPKLYRQVQDTPFTPEPILGQGRKSKKDLFGRSKNR